MRNAVSNFKNPCRFLSNTPYIQKRLKLFPGAQGESRFPNFKFSVFPRICLRQWPVSRPNDSQSMLSYFQIFILALIQGACELLPVSSSAHVIAAEKLM